MCELRRRADCDERCLFFLHFFPPAVSFVNADSVPLATSAAVTFSVAAAPVAVAVAPGTSRRGAYADAC